MIPPWVTQHSTSCVNMHTDFTGVWSGGKFQPSWDFLTKHLHQLFHVFSLLCKGSFLRAQFSWQKEQASFLTVSNYRKSIKKSKKVKLNNFTKLCTDPSDINSFIQFHQKRNRAEPRKYTNSTRSSRVLPTSTVIRQLCCCVKQRSSPEVHCSFQKETYIPNWRRHSLRNAPSCPKHTVWQLPSLGHRLF